MEQGGANVRADAMNALDFWRGRNGSDYIERNHGAKLLASYTAMWGRLLACMDDVDSVIEFGANIGYNLDAIKRLLPGVRCAALEPNVDASSVLLKKGYSVYQHSLQQWCPIQFDLAFTRGVLIHMPPEELTFVYDQIYRSSRRYIVVAEYYNPSPVAIQYRGEDGLLWKRDFAGEMLERFSDLRLVDYFFVYRRDAFAPQDDVTAFLMEKR